jgi:hypothetical protein
MTGIPEPDLRDWTWLEVGQVTKAAVEQANQDRTSEESVGLEGHLKLDGKKIKWEERWERAVALISEIQGTVYSLSDNQYYICIFTRWARFYNWRH